MGAHLRKTSSNALMSEMSQSNLPPAFIAWHASTGEDQGHGQGRIAGVPLDARMQRQLKSADFVPVGDLSQAAEAAAGWGIVIDGGWMIDKRLLAFLAAAGPGAALTGEDGAWAAFTAPAPTLHRLAGAGSRDFAALAARFAAEKPTPALVSTASIDPYVQTSRRSVPVRLMRLQSASDIAAAEATLLPDAQKGVLDWPARFIHPPIENAVVRMLWPTAVTPNQISILTFVFGLVAAGLFVAGQFGWGLAIALVCGAFDGVDGKLARTKLMVTAVGEWEHVSDKIVEYLWYLCLGIGLVRHGAPMLAIYAGIIATIGMGADIAVAGAAQRRLGRQIDDLGPLEQAIRLIGARRNTHMWLLVPFALFGAWTAGLVAVAASAVITLLLHTWRFGVALRRLNG
jgi:phosphatidylglycerophosphate synthase